MLYVLEFNNPLDITFQTCFVMIICNFVEGSHALVSGIGMWPNVYFAIIINHRQRLKQRERLRF